MRSVLFQSGHGYHPVDFSAASAATMCLIYRQYMSSSISSQSTVGFVHVIHQWNLQ